MARLGVAVVGLGLVALVMAYVFFGWPVLLIGVPAFVAVILVVLAVLASEAPRRRLEARRATRFDPGAQLPGGLMSGFFDVSALQRATIQARKPPEPRVPSDHPVRPATPR